MHHPDGADLAQVVALVQHDPIVVARLLRIVNSAYYGQVGEIKSLRRAIVVLGPITVLGIIMSMGLVEVRAVLDDRNAAAFLDLIRHSAATAFVAQRLLAGAPGLLIDERDRLESMSEVYTAGTLHDFGKLVLIYNHPREASRFYMAARGPHEDLLAVEKAVFGYDHLEAGVYLAQRLNFPAGLIAAIAFHHRPERLADGGGEIGRLAYAVAAGNLAANALGYTLNDACTWDDLIADPLWQQIVDRDVMEFPDADAITQFVASSTDALAAYVDAVV
jgi:HD-like signal output (HDOD) protein